MPSIADHWNSIEAKSDTSSQRYRPNKTTVPELATVFRNDHRTQKEKIGELVKVFGTREIRQGQFLSSDVPEFGKIDQDFAKRSRRLTIPLNTFPPAIDLGEVGKTSFPPRPMPTPLFGGVINLPLGDELEISPEQSVRVEPGTYGQNAIEINMLLPSPGPAPEALEEQEPQTSSNIYGDFGSPEPSVEPKPRFIIAPLEYDEFQESGYIPWKWIFISFRQHAQEIKSYGAKWFQ